MDIRKFQNFSASSMSISGMSPSKILNFKRQWWQRSMLASELYSNSPLHCGQARMSSSSFFSMALTPFRYKSILGNFQFVQKFLEGSELTGLIESRGETIVTLDLGVSTAPSQMRKLLPPFFVDMTMSGERDSLRELTNRLSH